MTTVAEQDLRQAIHHVRQVLLKKIEKKPNKYDEEDIYRVKTDQWTVLRFLKGNSGEVIKSGQKLDTCLQWRHEFKVNYISLADLPIEFFKSGGLFVFGKDMENRKIIFTRVKVHRKIPNLVKFFRQFLVKIIDKVDTDSGQTGYTLVFDLSGNEINHSMLKKKISYRVNINYVLIVLIEKYWLKTIPNDPKREIKLL